MNVAVEDSRLSKMRALRSFKNSQMTRSVRLRSALLGWSGRVVIVVHHCSTSSDSGQVVGRRSECVVQAATISQTRLVYLQPANRWCAVSIVVRHKMQESLCGQPRCASLSADQTRFYVMSHAKNLHLGGAQDFQMELMVGVAAQPRNCAL
jgi:hypothetical protein